MNLRARFLAITAVMILAGSGAAWAQRIEPAPGDGMAAIPNVTLRNDQLAARFLDQATAGARPEEVASLAAALTARPNTAFSEWIEAQFAKPVLPEDLSLNVFHAAYTDDSLETLYKKNFPQAGAVRTNLMISDNNNELRRMVAYALSQIFVVSDQDNPLNTAGEGLCDWYDMLYRDAFADFPTLLHDVTYHPVMADFLSSEGNAKAGFYNKNSRPDENYAREVMQLFTIGLVQLEIDGSVVNDNGRAIPTYSQPEITEVARVFTGLKYPTGTFKTPGYGTKEGVSHLVTKTGPVRYGVCEIEEKRHDTASKSFLGKTLPAGQKAAKDIDDTLQILCEHLNTAPFFARGMIQRLVTSNPSPGYIKRVATAFKTSKGDMKTVISAILLDPEARDPAYAKLERYGKLREPWLRLTQLTRAFPGTPPPAPAPAYPIYMNATMSKTLQYPLSAPSVFNFYLPNYQPPGPVSDRNMNATEISTLTVAPEFQIVNSNSALLTPNLFMGMLKHKADPTKPRTVYWLPDLEIGPQIALASDPAALVDNVSTLLTGGTMSERTRNVITEALQMVDNDPASAKERAKMAIYLTMISPDYAIQK